MGCGYGAWVRGVGTGRGYAAFLSCMYFIASCVKCCLSKNAAAVLTLTVLVTTIDAQWEGMGNVGSARYDPALLPPCPTISVLSYSN